MIIKSGGHLRSHVGGGGPEYIGERGSRGEVAPLLIVLIGTMIRTMMMLIGDSVKIKLLKTSAPWVGRRLGREVLLDKRCFNLREHFESSDKMKQSQVLIVTGMA